MYQYLPDLLSAQRGAFFNFLQEGLLKSVKSGLKSFRKVNGAPLQKPYKVHMRATSGCKWGRINTQKGSRSSFANRSGLRKPSLVRKDGRKLPFTRANANGRFFPSFTNTRMSNWPCVTRGGTMALGAGEGTPLSIKLKKPFYSEEEALKYSSTYETEMYASMQFAAFSSTYESHKGRRNVSHHQGIGHTNQSASPWLRKTSFYTNYTHPQSESENRRHCWGGEKTESSDSFQIDEDHTFGTETDHENASAMADSTLRGGYGQNRKPMRLSKKTRRSENRSQLPSVRSQPPDTALETWAQWYDATIERNKGGKAKCRWMPLLWCLPQEEEGLLVPQPSGGSKPGYGQNATATIDRKPKEKAHNHRLLSTSLQYEIPTTKAYISLGCFPLLTDEGSFIINGAKRMVMNQIIRSPGIYCKMQFRSRNWRTYTISYVSDRGVWLRIERDRSSYIWIRINNYQKIPLFVFLRALGITDAIVMASFEDTSSLWPSLKVGHPSDRKRALQYLGWVFRKGKKPLSVKQTRVFLYEKLFHPRYYSFTNAGRLNINKKFNHQFKHPTLSPEDILLGLSALLHLEKGEVPVDSIDHLKNKRVRLVHELLQNQVRRGFKRLEEDANIAPRDQDQSRDQAQAPVRSNDKTAPKSSTETGSASMRSKSEYATQLHTFLRHRHNRLRSPKAHNVSAHSYGTTVNLLGRWGGENESVHKAKADRCAHINRGNGTQMTKALPHQYPTADLFSKPNFSVFALDTHTSENTPAKATTVSVPPSSNNDDQRRSRRITLQPTGKRAQKGKIEKACNAVIEEGKSSSPKVSQCYEIRHAFWSPNRYNSISNSNGFQYDHTKSTENKNPSDSMVMAINANVVDEDRGRLCVPSTSAIDLLSTTSFSQTSVHSTRCNKRWYKKATKPSIVTSSFKLRGPIHTFPHRASGPLGYGKWQKQSGRNHIGLTRSAIGRKAKSYARNTIDRKSDTDTLPLQPNQNRNMAVMAFNRSQLKFVVIDDDPHVPHDETRGTPETEASSNRLCGVSALQRKFEPLGTHNNARKTMQHQKSTWDKVGVKLKTHPLYGAYERNAGVYGTQKVTLTLATGDETSLRSWQGKAKIACVSCAYVRRIAHCAQSGVHANHRLKQLPESQAQDKTIGYKGKGKEAKYIQSIGRTSFCFLYEAFATPLSSTAIKDTADLHCYTSMAEVFDGFYTRVNAHKSVLSDCIVQKPHPDVSPSHGQRHTPALAQSQHLAADKAKHWNGLHPFPKIITPPEYKPCHTRTPGYAKRRSSDKPCWILRPDCNTPKKDEGMNSYFSKLQKPISKTLKEFFGLNPLSQFMDEINPLGELTQKRRLTSLGPGGVTREAGLGIRDIHPSYYGRICPIETPEGKNAGLVNSLSTHSRINAFGFLETGYLAPSSMKSVNMEWDRLYHDHSQASNADGKLPQGESNSKANAVRNDEISMATKRLHSASSQSWVYTTPENWKWMKRFTCLSPEQEESFYILPISSATTENDRWLYHDPEINRQSRSAAYVDDQPLTSYQSTEERSPEGLHQAIDEPKALKANKERVADTRITCRYNQSVLKVSPFNIEFASVSSTSMISVATALIPFLEHDDGNRALMGSNMQRQGVPLFVSEKPIVATGMESHSARDSRAAITSKSSGRVSFSDCSTIEICHKSYTKYHLPLFQRTNQNTLLSAKPIVQKGDYVRQGDLIADTSSTNGGELSIGVNLFLGYMPWEGYNFEDAIVLNQRLVSQHRFTSVHIEKVKITTDNEEEFFAPVEKNKERGRINADSVEDPLFSQEYERMQGTTDAQVSHKPSPSATSVFFGSQTDTCEHVLHDESWGNLRAKSPVEMLSLLRQYHNNGYCESTIAAAWSSH